jgi:flagellum-specific ATP synthase
VEGARRLRHLHAKYEKARDLIQLGAYSPGHDAELDAAVRLHEAIAAMLQQDMNRSATLASSVEALHAVLGT